MDQCLEWDQVGFLARDGETISDYQERQVLLQKKFQDEQFLGKMPWGKRGYFSLEGAHFSGVAEITKRLFDFCPNTMWGIFSNKGLLPWHGGMTWIYEEEGYGLISILQFQKTLQKRKTFFGRSLAEIGAHEALHAFRGNFEGNDRFEEIIAYQTSRGLFRRFAGSLLRSSRDVMGFMVACLLPWVGIMMHDRPIAEVLFYAPLIYLFAESLRYFKDYRTFVKCQRRVLKLFPQLQEPLFVISRLKEEEIFLFANGSLEEVLSYIKSKSVDSIRWRQILRYKNTIDRSEGNE